MLCDLDLIKTEFLSKGDPGLTYNVLAPLPVKMGNFHAGKNEVRNSASITEYSLYNPLI